MRIAVAVVNIAFIVSATGNAQQRPSLAGTWKPVPGAIPNQPLPTTGQNGVFAKASGSLKITQDGKHLTLGDGSLLATYALDGSETVNAIYQRDQPVPERAYAKWVGDRLVITATFLMSGDTLHTTRTLFVDLNGNLVFEERTQFRRLDTRSKLVYIKKTSSLIS
ncbi:MAG: hypothetical protein V4550_17550 [Gemmatimonadota bacterium]